MDPNELDQTVTLMAQPVHDIVRTLLESDSLEDTPENRIEIYEVLVESLDEVFGSSDSLVKRVMTAVTEWLLEQEKINLQLTQSL